MHRIIPNPLRIIDDKLINDIHKMALDGYNINEEDGQGWTPLDYVLEYLCLYELSIDYKSIIEILMLYGSKPTDKTPYHIARLLRFYSAYATFRLFESGLLDVNHKVFDHHVPLVFLAATWLNLNAVEVLIGAGAYTFGDGCDISLYGYVTRYSNDLNHSIYKMLSCGFALPPCISQFTDMEDKYKLMALYQYI
jgi:hypothetical protein